MTENEAEILAVLDSHAKSKPADPWLAPRAFGGKDSSHHSVTVRRMIPKGWTLRQWRSHEARGSATYMITKKGSDALANHKASLGLAAAAKAEAIARGRKVLADAAS